MDLNIGDIIRLKSSMRKHEWEILRVGMDLG